MKSHVLSWIRRSLGLMPRHNASDPRDTTTVDRATGAVKATRHCTVIVREVEPRA